MHEQSQADRNCALQLRERHGSFPPGGVNRLIKNASEIGGWTNQDGLGYANALAWRALILPQLDQPPLYNVINFSVPSDAGGPDMAAGFTIWRTSLAVFLCPSDSGHEDGFRPRSPPMRISGSGPRQATRPSTLPRGLLRPKSPFRATTGVSEIITA